MGLISSIFERLGIGGSSAGAPMPVIREIEHAGTGGADAQAHAEAIALARHALRERNYSAAIERFNDAIEMRHDDAAAYCDMGIAYMKLKLYEDAADCFHMAVHFREEYADPHYHLGRLAHARADAAAAIGHLEQAIRLRPAFAAAHNLLGTCLWTIGDTKRAVAAFTAAVELQPDNAHYHSNLGHILVREFEEFERGGSHIEKALQLDGTDTSILCNYCLVLACQDRTDEIISLCDRLLDADPGDHVARLNRAIAKLKKRNFADAWPDYEARRHAGSNYLPRPFAFREWGGEPLTGKTVLVYAEQGLGDEIMFASCLPDILNQADRCIVDCSPRLEALFARSFPAAVVHGANQPDKSVDWLRALGTVDYQIAMGSLPGFFRRRLEDFPDHAGYLRADPERVGRWRSRLQSPEPTLKVGIAWRGGMRSTRRSMRSLELRELLPLLRMPGIRFVSLQHDATTDEVAAVVASDGVLLDHWPEVVADLDDTAALISALDLVVTVCSAPVHLSGALGRRAWVMVPAAAEWRYLERGESMPWYPSVRLFRQMQAGDWRPVIDVIGRELAQMRDA